MKTYHSEIAESIGNLPQNTKFTCHSAYEKTGDELFKRTGISQSIKAYSRTKAIKNGVKVHYGGEAEVTYTNGSRTIRKLASTFKWNKYIYSKKTIKRRKYENTNPDTN